MRLTEDFLIIEKYDQHFTVLYYNVDKDVLNTHQQIKYNYYYQNYYDINYFLPCTFLLVYFPRVYKLRRF